MKRNFWSIGGALVSLFHGEIHDDTFTSLVNQLTWAYFNCRFISTPKDMGNFNCGAFVAGIVKVCPPNFVLIYMIIV